MRPIKRAIRTFTDMDKVLFFTSLILIVFGSLNIVTASSREAVVNADANMFYYFFKHVIILMISLVAFIIVLNIETRDYKKWLPFIFITVFCLNAFLIIKGVATRGANNWINLGFMKIQPSELAKPTLILALSLLFRKYYYKLKDPKEKHGPIIWTIICCGLVFPGLVFLQKDLGTAIILFGIFAVMYIFSPIMKSEKIKACFISLGVVAVMLLGLLAINGQILSGAQTSRLKNFFNPCSKYEDTGYQVCNAFIAINNGGLTGVGLGKSTQKYSYIPEPHTDMVFAIIAEENGVLVCGLIFVAYLVIIYRILKLSMTTRRMSHRYTCIGVATYFFLHILINLGGLFGVIPLTGVPLPFLSYGGSFTLSLIATMGVIQRIHIELKNEKIKV